MKKIVFASNNAGKIREINSLLQSHDIEVIPQGQLGVPAPEETGLSFVENAILKARYAAERTGLPAIADDSGLVVDALSGEPGIYSARYAGEGASDADNYDKLMRVLQGVAAADRSARYQCLMVFMRHAKDPVPLIAQGTWEGRILEAPRGDGGFGYDPVFYVPELNCSAAELALDTKNSISHRAIALKALIAAMQSKGVIRP